eukprot:Clim_evm172s157 gene=Clim_evmTU172s157
MVEPLERQLSDLSTTSSHDAPLLKNEERNDPPAHSSSELLGIGTAHVPVNADFQTLLKNIRDAIKHGVFPTRIYQGSSGSYFARDDTGHIIGVFKPKDEEPYGRLNPKWMKWIHRVFLPCCFGRSCLIPNQGYMSEAGASLVDVFLGLNVVPRTEVVKLASPTFNYLPHQRARAKRSKRTGLPLKRGSLQTFVRGYKDASYWLQRFEREPDLLDEDTREDFQKEFERMVCLDYIIRNTDRGNDNWLIKFEVPEAPKKEESDALSPENGDDDGEISKDSAEPGTSAEHPAEIPVKEKGKEPVPKVRIELAAIDNGLAFPWKHPEDWRSYPFYWAWLPQARKPFSDEIAEYLLPILTSEEKIEQLCDALFALFREDPGFDARLFDKQMSVMRGQILNLVKALERRMTPQKLAEMPALILIKNKKDRSLIQKFRKRNPFFSWC